jgi:hypothetical protein
MSAALGVAIFYSLSFSRMVKSCRLRPIGCDGQTCQVTTTGICPRTVWGLDWATFSELSGLLGEVPALGRTTASGVTKIPSHLLIGICVVLGLFGGLVLQPYPK